MGRPTIWLSNWGSWQTPDHHGPGRRLCAMARPRPWEFGAGTIPALTPLAELLQRLHRREISMRQYLLTYLAGLGELQNDGALDPGALRVVDSTWWHRGSQMRDPTGERCVLDGDTALCACPRIGSVLRRHPCHLELAADALVRSGWDVVLYGERLTMAVPRTRCESCGPTAEVLTTFRSATCRSCGATWSPMLAGVIYAGTNRRYVRPIV